MTEITLNTLWNPQNCDLTARWVVLTFSQMVETALKDQPQPNVGEVMVNLGIADEEVAAYILAGAQHLFKRLDESPRSKLRRLREAGAA